MNTKIKNFLFHTFGISLFLIGLTLSIYLSILVLKPVSSSFMAFIMTIVFFSFWNLLTIGPISSIIDNKKSVLNYVRYFNNYINFKWIYHDKLGYFPSIVKDKKIEIYSQGIFFITKLVDVDTERQSIERISSFIKSHLDWVYQNRLTVTKSKDIIKSKKEEIKKWDGFLDTVSRRDKKIDDLLK
jgi:hypothetical protein